MSKRTIGIIWICAGILFLISAIVSKRFVIYIGLAAVDFFIGIANLVQKDKKWSSQSNKLNIGTAGILRSFNLSIKPETINVGILKGYYPFSGFQRQSLWWGWRGKAPHFTKRSAKGEFQNSPVDCFERGNALQERAFPDGSILFNRLVRPHKRTDFLRTSLGNGIPWYVTNASHLTKRGGGLCALL